jgi:hypothetical protein
VVEGGDQTVEARAGGDVDLHHLGLLEEGPGDLLGQLEPGQLPLVVVDQGDLG